MFDQSRNIDIGDVQPVVPADVLFATEQYRLASLARSCAADRASLNAVNGWRAMMPHVRNTTGSPHLRGVRDIAAGLLLLAAHAGAAAGPADDAKVVAELDVRYQAAVEKGDASGMAQILADDFVLSTGAGKTYSKSELLASARDSKLVYEHQVADSRTVRVWGDTAVVTALLWLKGTNSGKPFDYRLWYSDTYVRVASGWRYVFGHTSLPLPGNEQAR